MFNLLSDCSSEANAIIATIKLCVVASNEIGPQDPDGTCRGRHIQAPEGDGADIPLYLWLLQTESIWFYGDIQLFNSNMFTVLKHQ